MVLIAAIIFAVCLLVGIILAALAALGLWRTAKRRGGELAMHMEPISAGGAAAGIAAAGLEERRGQLEDAGGALAARAQVAALLGQAAAAGAMMVIFPLRFLINR